MLEAYSWGCRMHGRRTDQSYGIRWRERDTEKGGSAERSEERGEMRNVYCRGERLGLSLCAVPSPRRMWGSFDLQTEQGLRNNEGIVSGVVTQARKRIRTEY